MSSYWYVCHDTTQKVSTQYFKKNTQYEIIDANSYRHVCHDTAQKVSTQDLKKHPSM